jgi:hypothetical protein
MWRKIFSAGLILGLSLSMVVGCARNANPIAGSTDVSKADVPKVDNPEPVTLKLLQPDILRKNSLTLYLFLRKSTRGLRWNPITDPQIPTR